MEKRILLSVLISIFLFNLVTSAQVVQVEQPVQKETHWYSFLTSPLFWVIIVAVILVGLFILLIMWLVSKLVKYIKQRNDVFWKMRGQRMELAKAHSRYPSRHWWKVDKNTPIRIAKKDEQGRLFTKVIGFHRGDFVTNEGNICISMNLIGNKKYFFFPVRDLLVIPNKKEITIVQRNDKGEKIKSEKFELPLAKDMIQWNENEIILFIEGVSRVGIFMIPVVKSTDGKIIDLAMPIYTSMKEVILGDYLYLQSADFVHLSRKAVDMNVELRAKQKLIDSNQNVEIAQQQENI